VYPGTLFIGDSGAFLCIPMQIGVKFEHCNDDHARCPPLLTLGCSVRKGQLETPNHSVLLIKHFSSCPFLAEPPL
jgi:hypothetical protein